MIYSPPLVSLYMPREGTEDDCGTEETMEDGGVGGYVVGVFKAEDFNFLEGEAFGGYSMNLRLEARHMWLAIDFGIKIQCRN